MAAHARVSRSSAFMHYQHRPAMQVVTGHRGGHKHAALLHMYASWDHLSFTWGYFMTFEMHPSRLTQSPAPSKAWTQCWKQVVTIHTASLREYPTALQLEPVEASRVDDMQTWNWTFKHSQPWTHCQACAARNRNQVQLAGLQRAAAPVCPARTTRQQRWLAGAAGT